MKKVVSILMATMMLMSVSVYASNCFPATDSSGNVTNYAAVAGKTYWDLDFEDVGGKSFSFPESNSTMYLQFDSSNYATAHSNTFQGYKASKVESVTTFDKNYGKAIVLDGSEKTDSRINEIKLGQNGAGVDSSTILISEFDFALNAAPTKSVNVIWRPGLRYNNGTVNTSYYNDAARILIKQNTTELYVAANSSKTYELDTNKWYHICQIINCNTRKVYLYINGEYFIETQYQETYNSYSYNGILKLTATTNSSNVNKLYYDNIKVYEATTDFDLGLTLSATSGTAAVEGAPINLEISSNYDGLISHTEILTSTDGTNYTPYNSNVAYYTPSTTYYKAVAYGKDDSILDESNVVELAAEYLKSADMVQYDIDFDDGYTYANGSIKYNGGVIYPRNDTTVTNGLGGTAGGTAANMGIKNVSAIIGNTYGNSMFLSNTAQINEGRLWTDADIMVTEFDFAYGSLPASPYYNTVFQMSMTTDNNSSTSYDYDTRIELDSTGKMSVMTNSTRVTLLSTTSTNKWYKIHQVINTVTDKIDYYVDNQYIATINRTKKTNDYFHKFNIASNASTGNEIYVDNLNIYAEVDPETLDYDLTLTAAGSGYAVEGAPVNLEISSNYDEFISSTEILTSTDGVNYTPYGSDVAYYTPSTSYYKAVAYGAGGNKLDESNVVELAAEYVKSGGMLQYDIDFDDGYTYDTTKLLRYNDGVIYPRNNTTVTGGLGVTKNAVGAASLAVASSIPNNSFGTSLSLESTSTEDDGAQINEGRLWTNADIMVTEFDFAYASLPSSGKSNALMRMSMTDGSTSTSFDSSTYIALDSTGRIYVVSTNYSLLEETSPNTWYKICQVINTATDKIDYYIDDNYITTVDRAAANTGKDYFHKFNIATIRGNNTIYVDNLKIYSVASPQLKIVNVDFFIDDVASSSISAGDLTAQVTLFTDNDVHENLQCLAAVYGTSNKLERVSIAPVSFTENELTKLVEFDLGEVNADNSVEIFFWTITSEDLIPHGESAKLK